MSVGLRDTWVNCAGLKEELKEGAEEAGQLEGEEDLTGIER
jgi:hypothetical protein